MKKASIDPRAQFLARQLAAAGTGGGNGEKGGGWKPSDPVDPSDSGGEAPKEPKPRDSAPGPKDGKDRDAELLGKLREIIDELKTRTDPQAGDIDTAGSGERSPSQPGIKKDKFRKELRNKLEDVEDAVWKDVEDALRKKTNDNLKDTKSPRLKRHLVKRKGDKPNRPPRGIRPGGPGGGPIKMPNDPRDPLNLFNFLQEILLRG